jgi:hypothetical protein
MKFARFGRAQRLAAEKSKGSDALTNSQHEASCLKPFPIALLLLAAVCFFTTPLSAQNTFGAVVGNVTDSSGAIIAGANVTLTNKGTNAVATTKTGSAGSYVFPNLDPGQYSIKIYSQGFKTFTQTDVDVQVDGTTRVDAKLPVGVQTENVVVTAAPPVLQTDNATLSSVVEEQQIQETPLNGRNVNNLLTLVPGVAAGGSTEGNLVGNQYGGVMTSPIAFGNYQIGGGFGGQSGFYVDGVLTNIPLLNSNSLVLTQDAVQEFRVETNSVSAEFGGFAGGVVNMTSRNGTNQFHGSAYEYLRNTIFNANYWFNNLDGLPRAPWHQNQYGANLGGPVLKNKTFFFFSWEREKYTLATPEAFTIPTPDELNGDFSASGDNIYNFFAPPVPCTPGGSPQCQPQYSYNGKLNVIPPGQIDHAAQTIQKALFPAPQGPNANGLVNNWVGPGPANSSQTQYNARVDQHLGSKNTLFGRYTYWNPLSGSSDPFGNKTGLEQTTGLNQQAVIGDTHAFNATTVADIRLSYLRETILEETWSANPALNNISTIGPAFAALQTEFGGGVLPWVYYTSVYGGQPGQLWVDSYTNIFAIDGSLTKIAGRHTLKVGGAIRQVGAINIPENGSNLTFVSDPVFTAANPFGEFLSPSPNPTDGNGVASMLQGTPFVTSNSVGSKTHAFLHSYGFYATDTFQMTPKLTFNLGLRWDQPGAYSEVNDEDTVLLPNAPSLIPTIQNPVTGASQTLTGALALVNSPAYPSRREENLHWLLFQPRLGIAYRLTGTTALRLGYGISNLPSSVNGAGAFGSPINSASTSVTNIPIGFFALNNSVSDPFPIASYPNGVNLPIHRNAALLGNYLGQSISGSIPNQPYDYVQQYNLTVEKTLGQSTAVSLSYAGAAGVHLVAGGNLHQLPDQYDSMGAALLNQVPNPFFGKIANGTLAASTVEEGYLLQPYPQYTGFSITGARQGHSTYNALQTSVNHRFGRNGYVGLAYTWSKILANTDSSISYLDTFAGSSSGSIQDNTNLKAEKSLSQQDFPYNVAISYSYLLPFGANQLYLNHAGAVANAIVSGWRLNGITNFRSGQPVGLSAGTTSLSSFGTGTIRPNVAPNCPRSVSHTVKNGAVNWINTACYTNPGPFSFGNESRLDSHLRADGIKNFDLSLNKSTPIKENVRIVFDAEFFNIFNRHQFGIPDSTMTDAAFGQVTGTSGTPRVMQFALRLAF